MMRADALRAAALTFVVVAVLLFVCCLSGCDVHLEPDGHGGAYVSAGALVWIVALLFIFGRWGSR